MVTTNYIWDGESYLAETDENDAVTAVYTNVPDRYTNLVSQRRGATTSYAHFDALGSTKQLTDQAGAVTDEFEYDAWGNEIAHAGTTEMPFRYVGRYGYYQDDETDAIYILARTYQPSIARWWSRDPFLFINGINLYSYVRISLSNKIDPGGKVSCQPATEGMIKHISNRGRLYGWVQPLGGDLGSAIGSNTNLYFIRNNPSPFLTNCKCCCEEVVFAQIVKRDTKWTRNFGWEDWKIDANIPYPHTTPFNPCSEGTKAELRDSPNASNGWRTGRLLSLFQTFETCAICFKGIEKPLIDVFFDPHTGASYANIRGAVSYGCVTWHHSIVLTGDNYTYLRHLYGANPSTAISFGDTAEVKIPAGRAINGKRPSALFTAVVLSGGINVPR